MVRLEDETPVLVAAVGVRGIHVTPDQAPFSELLLCAAHYRDRYSGQPIGSIPGVEPARRFFHAIGLDPTKRRPSSEALLNRALKEKPLYSINTLVDICNWCSLDFLLPIGLYDLDKISGEVIIRRGRLNESYLALNDQVLNLLDRYVLADAQGPFGSPMTDSQRTAVTLETSRALTVVFAPEAYDREILQQQAELYAKRIVQFCGGDLSLLRLVPDPR